MEKTIKRTAYLLGTILFLAISFLTAQGTLQKYIHFAGISNEIGFFLFSSMLTVIFAYLTVTE